MDDNWKQELEKDQLDEIEGLGNCSMLEPASSKQNQHQEISVSVPYAPNIVRRLQLSSTKQFDSYLTPSFPSALPPSFVQNYDGNIGTSPSLRSLNPGYVASLARFWSSKCRIKRDKLSSTQDGHGDDQEINEDLDSQDFGDLKDSFIAQFELFRASEEENMRLRDELHLSLDDLKMKETLVDDLKENMKILNEKVTSLLKDGLDKDSRILDLEELLQISQSNQCKEQEQGGNLNFKQLKEEHERLKIKVKKYEDMVEDLKDHIIPIKNLKSKIGTLDQDVRHLRDKLQNNVCSTSKYFKSKTFNLGAKQSLLSPVPGPNSDVSNVNIIITKEETKISSLQSGKKYLNNLFSKAFSRNHKNME